MSIAPFQNENKRGADTKTPVETLVLPLQTHRSKSEMDSPVLDTPPLANPNIGRPLTPADGLYKYPQLLLLKPKMLSVSGR